MTANDTTSLIAKAAVRGSPIRGLVLGGVLLIAAIMIGTTIMANNFRERALNSSELFCLPMHFHEERDLGTQYRRQDRFGQVIDGSQSICLFDGKSSVDRSGDKQDRNAAGA